ncbi:MAG: oligosaccharide flippase family protein [Pseudolabrys sp.]
MIKDALQYMVGKMVPGLAGLLFVVVFVRIVGEDNYGRFALIFSVGNAAGALAAGWLNQAQLRYYTKFKGSAWLYRGTLRRGLIFSVAAVWVVTSCVLAYAGVERSAEIFRFALLAGLLATAMVLHSILVTLFQAKIKPHQVVVVEFFRAVLSVLLPLLLLVAWGQNYTSLVAGVALSFLVPVVLFQGRAWPVDDGQTYSDRDEILKKFWSFGWPLSLWLACMMSFQVVDRYLIQHFYGFNQTGTYAGLYDLLIRFYSLVFFPVTMAVHPRVMAAWNAGDKPEYVRTLRFALSIQIGFFLLVLLILGFVDVAPVLQWAIPGMVAADRTLVVLWRCSVPLAVSWGQLLLHCWSTWPLTTMACLATACWPPLWPTCSVLWYILGSARGKFISTGPPYARDER